MRRRVGGAVSARRAGHVLEAVEHLAVFVRVGVADEHAPLVADDLVDARIDAVGVTRLGAGQDVVAGLRERVRRRRVRQRPILRQRAADAADAILRNEVAGKRVADERARIVRIGPGRRRVVEDDRLAVRVAQVREVAGAPLRQRHRQRRDRARFLTQALVIHEEERLVRTVVAGKRDRTPNVAAELIALELARALPRAVGEEVRRVHLAVPAESKRGRVKRVAAALGDQVDDATAEAPELRAHGVGLHAELLHCVHRRRVVQVEDRDVVLGVDVRHAVNRDLARGIAAAADEGRRSWRGRDSRRERRERERIAAVQRQIDEALVLDRLADRGAGGLDRGSAPDHRDQLGGLPELECHINTAHLLDVELYFIDGRALESRFRDRDVVEARLQLGGDVATFRVGLDRVLFVGGRARNRHVGVGHDRAG